jgi:PAS domain S-box-containing protein
MENSATSGDGEQGEAMAVRGQIDAVRQYMTALRRAVSRSAPGEAVDIDQAFTVLDLVLAGLEPTSNAEPLHVLFEYASDAILHFDPHDPEVVWPIVSCNDQAARMNGYASADELIGKPMDLLHLVPSDRDYLQAFLERIRAEGSVRGATLHRRKDGSIIPIEYVASLVTIGGRELVLGIDQDVTRRAQALSRLRESETRLRLVNEQLPAVLWTTDAELRFTSTSGNGLRHVQEHPELEQATSLYELYESEPTHPAVTAHQNALKGVASSYEARRYGQVLQAHVEPFVDEHGTIIGTIGIALDITERIDAEMLLQESEQRFRRVFEEAPIGMAIIDLDFRILQVNRALCDMLEYDEEDLLGQTLASVTHPEDLEKDTALATMLFEGTIPNYTIQKRYLTRRGAVVWGRLTATVFRGDDGKAQSALGMVEIITARKRAELLVEAERRRVAYELHDGVAQLIASVHFHLQAYAARARPRNPVAREQLFIARDLAQLAVSESRRIIAGLRPTVLDEFGLIVALRKEIDILENRGWSIDFVVDPGLDRLPSILETSLYWVAQEALTNVRKHAQTQEVRVRLGRTEGGLRLEIEDHGTGFDYATVRPGTAVGEHIGLLGMQERVALLDGRLEIQSSTGHGTLIVADVPWPDQVEQER